MQDAAAVEVLGPRLGLDHGAVGVGAHHAEAEVLGEGSGAADGRRVGGHGATVGGSSGPAGVGRR